MAHFLMSERRDFWVEHSSPKTQDDTATELRSHSCRLPAPAWLTPSHIERQPLEHPISKRASRTFAQHSCGTNTFIGPERSPHSVLAL